MHEIENNDDGVIDEMHDHENSDDEILYIEIDEHEVIVDSDEHEEIDEHDEHLNEIHDVCSDECMHYILIYTVQNEHDVLIEYDEVQHMHIVHKQIDVTELMLH